MIKEFRNLDRHESEFMFSVPMLVCILIAGADGDIDRKEIREAISVASKNKESSGILSDYFREVANDFEDKLKVLIQSYPYESTQRDPIITEDISRINRLWAKLDPEFSVNLYRMLLDLSEKIASSSGGWLGIKSVGSQEARYVKLPMIQDPSKI